MLRLSTDILKNLPNLLKENSPVVLTGVAVAGTVSTALLTAKATFRAREEWLRYDWNNDLVPSDPRERRKEAVSMTWKHYIPPVVTGAVTIGCIVGANTVSSRRNTALVTAYSLTDRAFSEYKEKVIEQIGETKEQRVRDAIAQDRVNQDPPTREIVIAGSGDVLCFESLTGRYFSSTMETLRKAQNDVNSEILTDMYQSQNDFHRLIGLDPTGYGETVGWNTDKMLELQFSSILSPDGKPCLSIGYRHLPFVNYSHMH